VFDVVGTSVMHAHVARAQRNVRVILSTTKKQIFRMKFGVVRLRPPMESDANNTWTLEAFVSTITGQRLVTIGFVLRAGQQDEEW